MEHPAPRVRRRCDRLRAVVFAKITLRRVPDVEYTHLRLIPEIARLDDREEDPVSCGACAVQELPDLPVESVALPGTRAARGELGQGGDGLQ